MEHCIPLCSLLPMQQATISRLDVQQALRRRLNDLGVIEGTRVMCLRVCPLGDPVLYLLRGTVLALRKQDAARIGIRMTEERGEERE